MFVIKKSTQFSQLIAAIEPVYGEEGGNATRIYNACGGVTVDPRRQKTVLDRLVSSYGLSLTALRSNNFGRPLGKTLYAILPLANGLVLVPVKTRLPLAQGDGATGYINACAVEKIEDAALADPLVRCLIHLQGGQILPCYNTRATVQKRIEEGFLALERQLDRQRFNHSPLFRLLSTDYPTSGATSAELPIKRSSPHALDFLATAIYLLNELIVDHRQKEGV